MTKTIIIFNFKKFDLRKHPLIYIHIKPYENDKENYKMGIPRPFFSNLFRRGVWKSYCSLSHIHI